MNLPPAEHLPRNDRRSYFSGQANADSGYMVSATHYSNETGGDVSLQDTSFSSQLDVHAELFLLCASALPRGEDLNKVLSDAEIAQRRAALEETWAAIRVWIEEHPDQQQRTVAADYQGQCANTVLHECCKLTDPPTEIIAMLIACSESLVRMPDNQGWLPVHHACANGASGEVLSLLCEAYPEGKEIQDSHGRTPLHFAFFRRDSEDEDKVGDVRNRTGNSIAEIVKLLSSGGAARLADENGMLPMHYACSYGTSTAVLDVLLQAYPESIAACEKKGRTPLHSAMVNALRSSSPSVVRFLLKSGGKKTIMMIDSDGNLPIKLLGVAAHHAPLEEGPRKNAAECLVMYLDAEPRADADFLSALQSLPGWLRDYAVVNHHVHDILNKKIAQRFPTSILLCDAFMLLMIIIAFEQSVHAYIDFLFAQEPKINNWPIVVLYIGSTYFFCREVFQMISLLSLGTFRSWLFDSANWLDITVIILGYYYATVMYTESASSHKEVFRSGVAVAQGIFWVAAISYLRSTMVDFAVFVGGVTYVVRRLAAFLMAVSVILVAFAQMLVIVYRNTCYCPANVKNLPQDVRDEIEKFPHCHFADSLLKVYTMMMGEIGGEERYNGLLIAQVLYIAYAFLVVILLSNVLIAIVTDSYGVIKNERAAMVFWSNRLDFVAEMDAITSVVKKIACFGMNRHSGGVSGGDSATGQESRAFDSEESGRSKLKTLFRSGWSHILGLFDADQYAEMNMTVSSLEFWLFFVVKFIAITIIIPLWILLGLATFGLLWPPQVREWLFVQRRSAISRADLAAVVSKEMKELRTDISAMRLKMKSETKVNKLDRSATKAESAEVQREVLADLQQVKELLTTLLDLSRRGGTKPEEEGF